MIKGYQSLIFITFCSGLYPLLEKIMNKFLGEKAKDIKIISNNGTVEGRNWKIEYRDDSEYGNDKSRSKYQWIWMIVVYEGKSKLKPCFCQLALKEAREAASPDTIFVFCGDGVSDISAAKHADVLFARKDRDLETYCNMHKIPFIPFDTFHEVHAVVKKLVDGKAKIEKDGKTGFCNVIDV